MKKNVDIIYLAIGPNDAHLARICIGSIRYFYPEQKIKILQGFPAHSSFLKELNVLGIDSVVLPKNDFGWGFVKIEPLFLEPKHKYLVMDVDTIFTGKVLERAQAADWDFFVDNEYVSKTHMNKYYFNSDKMIANGFFVPDSANSFSGGQWFGTAGLIKRQDFEDWLSFDFPRKLKYPEFFFGGEQGVVSLVVLIKETLGMIKVKRDKIMIWAGEKDLEFSLLDIENRKAPGFIIHWAGVKALTIKEMPHSDLLIFFEEYYYSITGLSNILKKYHRFIYMIKKLQKSLRDKLISAYTDFCKK